MNNKEQALKPYLKDINATLAMMKPDHSLVMTYLVGEVDLATIGRHIVGNLAQYKNFQQIVSHGLIRVEQHKYDQGLYVVTECNFSNKNLPKDTSYVFKNFADYYAFIVKQNQHYNFLVDQSLNNWYLVSSSSIIDLSVSDSPEAMMQHMLDTFTEDSDSLDLASLPAIQASSGQEAEQILNFLTKQFALLKKRDPENPYQNCLKAWLNENMLTVMINDGNFKLTDQFDLTWANKFTKEMPWSMQTGKIVQQFWHLLLHDYAKARLTWQKEQIKLPVQKEIAFNDLKTANRYFWHEASRNQANVEQSWNAFLAILQNKYFMSAGIYKYVQAKIKRLLCDLQNHPEHWSGLTINDILLLAHVKSASENDPKQAQLLNKDGIYRMLHRFCLDLADSYRKRVFKEAQDKGLMN